MAAVSERDDPFQQILHLIGGKSNIHLITGPDGNNEVLHDFIADMFNNGEREESSGNSNGEIKIQTHVCGSDQSEQSSSKPDPITNKTVRSSRKVDGKQRDIKCALIVFIFRHEYVCDKNSYLCLREILKDVRARIKRNAHRPALLGLVHTEREQTESRESIESLDRSLRSVFVNHPQQAIWTGRYVTKSPDLFQEIRWSACRAVKSSLSAESGAGSKSGLFCSLKCLPGLFRTKHTEQTDFSDVARQQGIPNWTEEGIPLQMQPVTH